MSRLGLRNGLVDVTDTSKAIFLIGGDTTVFVTGIAARKVGKGIFTSGGNGGGERNFFA